MTAIIIKDEVCVCYLPKPKAEADNTNRGLDNYRYHCKKPNPIIVLL
jgi:hypothetical protein